jgi:hypothetical protein
VGGHSCNARIRCRIVSLIRGRCLMALAKTSRACRHCAGVHQAVLRPLFDLVEVANVRNQRVVGFFVVAHRCDRSIAWPRTIIVESPDRFARDLAVQLAGLDQLKKLGVTLIPATAPDLFTEDSRRSADASDPPWRCLACRGAVS